MTALFCFLNSFSAGKSLLTNKNLWNQRVDFWVKNVLEFTLIHASVIWENLFGGYIRTPLINWRRRGEYGMEWKEGREGKDGGEGRAGEETLNGWRLLHRLGGWTPLCRLNYCPLRSHCKCLNLIGNWLKIWPQKANHFLTNQQSEQMTCSKNIGDAIT